MGVEDGAGAPGGAVGPLRDDDGEGGGWGMGGEEGGPREGTSPICRGKRGERDTLV